MIIEAETGESYVGVAKRACDTARRLNMTIRAKHNDATVSVYSSSFEYDVADKLSYMGEILRLQHKHK